MTTVHIIYLCITVHIHYLFIIHLFITVHIKLIKKNIFIRKKTDIRFGNQGD
jgi:hypothetical protein